VFLSLSEVPVALKPSRRKNRKNESKTKKTNVAQAANVATKSPEPKTREKIEIK